MEYMEIRDKTGKKLVISRQPSATKFVVVEEGKEPELISPRSLHNYIKAWMKTRKQMGAITFDECGNIDHSLDQLFIKVVENAIKDGSIDKEEGKKILAKWIR